MRVTSTRRLAITTMLLLAVAGCGGETSSDPSTTTTTTTSTSGESPAETTTTLAASATTDTPTNDGENTPLTLQDVFAPIATDPTEPGPRPLLAWETVAGADIYEVVVLGSDGKPYWAWSGAATQINVGGIAEPEALGAWVHEEMTWTVSASGSDGEVLGLSAPAKLVP